MHGLANPNPNPNPNPNSNPNPNPNQVQQILHAAFVQLTGIFSHYCKANWTPDDAEERADTVGPSPPP